MIYYLAERTTNLTEVEPLNFSADEEEEENLDLPKRDPIVLQKDKKYEDFYESGEELGKGKFGVVRKCKDKKTGEIYAAKFIRTTAESRKEVLGEMEMMNLLSSKRLIYLQDAFERPKEMIIILEFIAGGELFEKVCAEDNLSEKDVVRYMRQILQGVQHMHKQNMIHLDLKPENVLCVVRPDGKEDLKLIDFGMAKVLKPGKKVTAGCGTPEFVAPEALAMDPLALSADMWSVGVIAYVLLSGLSPFMGDDDSETMNNVASCEWDFEDEAFEVVSDMSKKFIEELLILNPKKRLTVGQCLDHVWLHKKTKLSGEKLSTDKLKQFMARRRWIKTANALRALSRMGSLSGLLGGGKDKKPEKPSPQLTSKRAQTVSARPAPSPYVNLASPVKKLFKPEGLEKRFKDKDLPLKLENPEKYYNFSKQDLGRGKWAVVRRAVDKKTKKANAAKIIKYDSESIELVLQEFEIHRTLKNEKILGMRDAYICWRYAIFMFDVVEGLDCLTFIGQKPRANEEDICFVLRPLLEALKYLHGQKVVHLDIRPANIILTKDYKFKLIDFGSARKVLKEEGEVGGIVGNPEFTAPEMYNYENIHWGADMWSVGVVTYMLLSGLLPFTGEDEDAVERAVADGKWSFDAKAFSNATAEARDFVSKSLVRVADKRHNAVDALAHPWFVGDNLRKRRGADINTQRLKEINQKLKDQEAEELVYGSFNLRGFEEDPYESPDTEEEEEE